MLLFYHFNKHNANKKWGQLCFLSFLGLPLLLKDLILNSSLVFWINSVPPHDKRCQEPFIGIVGRWKMRRLMNRRIKIIRSNWLQYNWKLFVKIDCLSHIFILTQKPPSWRSIVGTRSQTKFDFLSGYGDLFSRTFQRYEAARSLERRDSLLRGTDDVRTCLIEI